MNFLDLIDLIIIMSMIIFCMILLVIHPSDCDVTPHHPGFLRKLREEQFDSYDL